MARRRSGGPLAVYANGERVATSTGAFDLLREIGRDCVGAVQILPDDVEPPDVHRVEASPLTESDIAELLRTIPSSSVAFPAARENFRISMAGAQEKTALLFHDGRWLRPRAATPTTHILKLPLGTVTTYRVDLSRSPENEWLCGRVLAAYELPVAESRVAQFEDQRVLIVERFDRVSSRDRSWIIRRPVEDFCQATATPPGEKYESDGGPGIADILALLGSSQEAKDRELFLSAQILMWMLAAPDAHAKNFSIFLESGGHYRLTPLYDVMSVWPVVGRGRNSIPLESVRMAMAVSGKNRHYHWDRISARHWIETGRRHGVPEATTVHIIEQLIERTEAVIDHVGSQVYGGYDEATASAVFDGLRVSARRLKQQLEKSAG